MFRAIRVDSKMDRAAVEIRCSAIDQRELGPYARMIQLCLMPGGDQRNVIVGMPDRSAYRSANFRQRNLLKRDRVT